MGCGHSSSFPPVSCTVLQRKSTTRLFTVPKFSEWARTPAGTALHFEPFNLRGMTFRLKVYPAGFDDGNGAEGFVALFINGLDFADSGTNVSFEILDARGESAVFDGRTAGSEQKLLDDCDHMGFGRDKGYVRFVGRKELEASRCIRADGGLTVRCTVDVDLEVTKSIADAACFSPTGATSRLSPPPPPSLPQRCTWRKTKATTHLFPVTEFSSKWARMPAGHALNFKRFSFRGSSWRLMLFPAGLRDGAGDFVAVFVELEVPRMLLKGTRISIEILDASGERAVLDNRTVRSELTTVEHKSARPFWLSTEYRKGYARFVGRKDLGDSFTIRCTLSADEVVAKQLSRGTSPPAVVSLSGGHGKTNKEQRRS